MATNVFGATSKPPADMGKYVMVLWEAGSPLPDGSPGKIKKVAEPDIAKLGGVVLSKTDNRRVIFLPLKEAKHLRRHDAVAYLQRLWTGESLEDWDETYPPNSALTPRTDSDINLEWGPKAYTYDSSGNIKTIGPDSYTYDTAGRLLQATIGGKTESFKYDAFGNLTEKTITGQNAVTIPVDGASNRLIGPAYDAAGNVVTDQNRRNIIYDSFNMMTVITPPTDLGGEYHRIVYDANDERIGTVLGVSLARWTIRDFDGQIVREYRDMGQGQWTWVQDNIYAEGALVAGETQEFSFAAGGSFTYGGRRHYHLDHLGSVRMVTNNAGRSVSENDYYAFGTTQTKNFQEELNAADNHVDGMRFAGHWRDFLGLQNVESNDYLDYMHARYYSPTTGRFLSVDPVVQIKRAMSNPQMWNRYSYALNNPMVYTDPTGKTVYLVTYTTGNTAGDDEFRRAAMTRANDITHRKGFDPTKDTVLLRGVANKWAFKQALRDANALGTKFGRVGEVSLFSHAGPRDGPIFQSGQPEQHQFAAKDLGEKVNWEYWGDAKFFGCNTGINFTGKFASAQGVTAYGYEGFASFSSTQGSWSYPQSTGPMYLIQTTGWSNGGAGGVMGKWTGYNDKAVPMDPDP